MMAGKKPIVAKYEVIKLEHAQADALEDRVKNPNYGFKCLHYSVSESSQKLTIPILNKTGKAGSIRVKTVDAEAKAGEDFEAVDRVLEFRNGESQQQVDIIIHDDDNWEPDEDFFVQLFDPMNDSELEGQDTKTRVTIIDDDKPGQICFEEPKGVKAAANEEFAEIVILRKNGSDGIVTVDYDCVQLDSSDHTATPYKDYEPQKGTLTFQHGETKKSVQVKIIPKGEDEVRDESFGFKLYNCNPEGAKLSKKAMVLVNIVTDLDKKRQQDAYTQLLAKIEAEEATSWKSQFITACMLHPTKGENGEI